MIVNDKSLSNREKKEISRHRELCSIVEIFDTHQLPVTEFMLTSFFLYLKPDI